MDDIQKESSQNSSNSNYSSEPKSSFDGAVCDAEKSSSGIAQPKKHGGARPGAGRPRKIKAAPADPTTQTKEGLIAKLTEVVNDPNTRPKELAPAARLLANLTGVEQPRSRGYIKKPIKVAEPECEDGFPVRWLPQNGVCWQKIWIVEGHPAGIEKFMKWWATEQGITTEELQNQIRIERERLNALPHTPEGWAGWDKEHPGRREEMIRFIRQSEQQVQQPEGAKQ